MGGKRYSVRERARYRFDNFMSKGVVSKVKALLGVTLVFILVVGTIAAIISGGINVKVGQSYENAWWKTFMYTIGKGVLGTGDGSPAYVILMLITIMYCLFFTAILIGLINQGIRAKVDDLGKGQGKVLEEGHTVILGFNDATYVLLSELIEANRNQLSPETVVILDDVDRADMLDAIQRRLGLERKRPQVRLKCRTGLCFSLDDLRRCSIETSRAIIVNAANDFEAVKAIMACTHILNESDIDNDPFIVAAIADEEGIVASRIAGHSSKVTERLELLPLSKAFARIMVHASRQPGLSDIFTELFNFDDDEFYIVSEDPSLARLRGKSVAEINLYLQTSYAVGVVRKGGDIVIAPPREVVLGDGDSLIVAAEDDGELKVSAEPVAPKPLSGCLAAASETTRVLILGARPMLDDVLAEYAYYLHSGSIVYVVDEGCDSGVLDEIVSDGTKTSYAQAGVSLEPRDIDIGKGKQLVALLDEVEPDCVLVLTGAQDVGQNDEDDCVFRVLLILREYRNRTGRHFSITSEMHLAANKELASKVEPDDFIISKEIGALLMAQISQKREMAQLFDTLLSSEGFEVYMKPAAWYAPVGEPVDLVSVGESVANRGEVLIGIRQKNGAGYAPADVNPSKYVSDMQTLRQYVFGEDDYLVVLAEDAGLPKGEAECLEGYDSCKRCNP